MPTGSLEAIRRARRLRSEMTDAERRLWSRLRGQQIRGARFRRQVLIGPYIVDFACLSHRLIIEVDGGQHAQNVSQDEVRTSWLASRGYRVVRYWDNDVLKNTDEVLESIWTSLEIPGPHHPDSPRKPGRDI
jgi:very-short-patch-repair endonuclease